MGLATLMYAGSSGAQQSGLKLDWEAPPGCPSKDDVLKRLRAIVGKSVDDVGRLRAHGRIERSDEGYRLTLKLLDGQPGTERVIRSSSCTDLGGAAAVALGLLVRDAEQGTAGGAGRAGGTSSSSADHSDANGAAPSAGGTSAGGAAVTTDAPSATDEPSGSPRRFQYLLRAPLLGVDVGPLPEPSVTFGLAFGVTFEALEFTVGGRLGLAQTVWVDGSAAYGAELQRASIELGACYAFHSDRFAVAPCLRAALDPISARGVGEEVTAQTDRTAVFGIGAGLLGKFRLADALALVASVGGQVQTSRPEIVVEGLGAVTKLAPFLLTTSAGVEWIL